LKGLRHAPGLRNSHSGGVQAKRSWGEKEAERRIEKQSSRGGEPEAEQNHRRVCACPGWLCAGANVELIIDVVFGLFGDA
jgi:hypothetical protein